MGAKESEVANIPTLSQRMRKARGTRRRNEITVEAKRERPGKDERREGGGKWVVRIRSWDRGFSPINRFLHRPESRFCRLKCPHRAAVTTGTLENLVFRKGDVSTLPTHKATISSRAQQHEVVNQNAVWATGLFDHGWLLGGGWPKSNLILRPNC